MSSKGATPDKAAVEQTPQEQLAETPVGPTPEPVDVEMADANGEDKLPEDTTYKKRSALLIELLESDLESSAEDKYSTAYPWKLLTSDVVNNLKSEEKKMDDLISRLRMSPGEAHDLFFEVLLCVVFYQDRLSHDVLYYVLDTVLDSADSDQERTTNLIIPFITTINAFDMDTTLKTFLTRYTSDYQIRIIQLIESEKSLPQLGVNMSSLRRAQNAKIDTIEQPIYNLIQEAGSGYAKIITTFMNSAYSQTSTFAVKYTVTSINSLIGHFNLDSTKVLDLLLSCASSLVNVNPRFVVNFFKNSPWWPAGAEGNIASLEGLADGGSALVAHMLSKKIQSAHPNDVTNFWKLTSLFLRQGFISFGAFFEFLPPGEEEMTQFATTLEERLRDKVDQASSSALALSGPLADEDEDGNPIALGDDPELEAAIEKQEPTENLKFQLFERLIKDAQYYPVLFLLCKYPTLAIASDDTTKLCFDLFNKMIAPLKESMKPLPAEMLQKLSAPRVTTARMSTRLTNMISSYQSGITDGSTSDLYEFFPTVSTVDELLKYVSEFLSFWGARIGENPHLVSFITKVALHDLEEGTNESDKAKKLETWFNITRKYILPASTYIEENPVAAHDMFKLLKKFPLDWRYNMYGEFQLFTAKNNQLVRMNYGKAEKNTKDVLKRLTKENVKSTMRRLSKITFANPLPAFTVLVSQLESYDNLTSLVVEAARYFTDYAWDVLVFVVLTRLTVRRDSMQADGINDQQWLQSLSSFIGKLAKGYPEFNIKPLLRFSLISLYSGQSIGLTIFKEIVGNMGGLQLSTNLVPNQIKQLSSSTAMQKIGRTVIRDTRDQSIRSGARLVETLATSGQLFEFFVVLVKYSTKLTEGASADSPFKVITDLYDQCASTIHTYLELLDQFTEIVASSLKSQPITIDDLINRYGISAEWSFEVWRKTINVEDSSHLTINSPSLQLTDKLYRQFWSLGLYDILFESELYSSELVRVQEQTHSNEERVKIAKAFLSGRRRATDQEVQEERKVISEASSIIEVNKSNLESFDIEKEKHEAHSKAVLETLKSSYESWFTSGTPSTENISAFVEHCVLPRLLHSGYDAVFTGVFVTTCFPANIRDAIVSSILKGSILPPLIFTLTSLEAENLGLFTHEVFTFYDKVSSEAESKASSYTLKKEIITAVTATVSETDDYLSRRNTFNFLRNFIPVIGVNEIGEAIREAVEECTATESREDLKLASSAIVALLQSTSSKWVSSWHFMDLDDEKSTSLKDERHAVLRRRMLKKREIKREAEKKLAEERAKRKAELEAARAAEERRLEEERAARELEKQKLEDENASHAAEETKDADSLDSDQDMVDELEEKEDYQDEKSTVSTSAPNGSDAPLDPTTGDSQSTEDVDVTSANIKTEHSTTGVLVNTVISGSDGQRARTSNSHSSDNPEGNADAITSSYIQESTGEVTEDIERVVGSSESSGKITDNARRESPTSSTGTSTAVSAEPDVGTENPVIDPLTDVDQSLRGSKEPSDAEYQKKNTQEKQDQPRNLPVGPSAPDDFVSQVSENQLSVSHVREFGKKFATLLYLVKSVDFPGILELLKDDQTLVKKLQDNFKYQKEIRRALNDYFFKNYPFAQGTRKNVVCNRFNDALYHALSSWEPQKAVVTSRSEATDFGQKFNRMIQLVKDGNLPGIVELMSDRSDLAAAIQENALDTPHVREMLVSYFTESSRGNSRLSHAFSTALFEAFSGWGGKVQRHLKQQTSRPKRAPLPPQEHLLSGRKDGSTYGSSRQGDASRYQHALPSGPSRDSRNRNRDQDRLSGKQYNTGQYRVPSESNRPTSLPAVPRMPSSTSQSHVPVVAPPPPPPPHPPTGPSSDQKRERQNSGSRGPARKRQRY